MEYRALGRTGLKISALSYGASPLGDVFGKIDESAGIACVRRALDLGINFIDVAPFYGLTKAETVLGKALRGVPRDAYILATKVGRYGHEPKDFDHSARRVTASVDESLARLGVDHVDLIQCHDIEFVSLDQIVEETIPALRRVREAGKARFIGITGLPLHAFKYVLDRTETDTVLSYCHYSLNDSSLEHLVPYLKAKGMGIINASPLSMGLLSQSPPPAWHPCGPEIRKACARAAELCRKRGADLSKLAVQFSTSNPDLATTIVGTSHAEKIERNVKWLGEPVDRELLAEVLEVLKPVKNRGWQQGIPVNYPVCVKTGKRTGKEGYFYTAEGPVLAGAAAKPRKAARPAARRRAAKKPARRKGSRK
jgi:L-galactose dehydrogenase